MLGDGDGKGGAGCKCLAVKNGAWTKILAGTEGIVTSGKINPCLVGPRNVGPLPHLGDAARILFLERNLCLEGGERQHNHILASSSASAGEPWDELVHPISLLLLHR